MSPFERKPKKTLTTKVPNDADTDALGVVARRVRTDEIPAPALVNIAILADEEAVADVEPAVPIHVVVLVRADYGRAGALVATVGGYAAVMDDDVGRGPVGLGDVGAGLAGAPLRAADYAGTGIRIDDAVLWEGV